MVKTTIEKAKLTKIGNKKNTSYYICVPKFLFNDGTLSPDGFYKVEIERLEFEAVGKEQEEVKTE